MRDTLRANEKGTMVDQLKWTSGTRLVNSEPVAEVAITQRGIFCVQINRLYRAYPCARPLTVYVVVGAFVLGFGSDYELTVDWGDGITNGPTDFTGLRVFEHTYAAAGTFNITSSLVTQCAHEIFLTTAAEVTVGGACDNQVTNENEWSQNAGINGSIGMSSEIWTANDLFGTHSGAKTTCYERINNKWRERQGNVSAHIDSDFRDQECNVEDTEDETDSCNSCRHKKATVASSPLNKFHFTGDVTSTHSVTRNGVTLTNNLELEFDCD